MSTGVVICILALTFSPKSVSMTSDMRGFIGKFSLGRYRQRPAFLLVIAFVMAIFAVAVPFSRTAYAADVTRSGDSFVYGGNTFAPVQQGEMPTGLPSDTSGYLYRNNPIKKAEFIFISGDTKTATTAEYVIYDMTPPSNFSKPSPPKTLSIAAIAPSSASSAINGAKSTCSGDITQGMGWILCPVVNFLASGMDHLYQMLTGFLEVRPVQTDQTSALYRMWAIIRDIANVCFVIAFLFIVYSQITSVGITNYGIKKLLPRLIIGAVLVNTSFLISSLAVDLSNFLGYSIHDLFTSIFSSLNTTDQYKDLNWSNIAANVLSGGAIGAGAVYGGYVLVEASVGGALILLIPTLVGVLLSVLVALLVISARQALITVLIIVSPLAFVAYLLPNTEKYFTKWRELFMTLLLVFPMFALIFGGAQIAGLAIIQNANSLNLVILGMAVQVAPIVVTPMLIKLSGSLVGKIAGIVNNPKAGIMDRTKNWAKERSAQHKSMVLAGVGRNSQMNRWTRAVDYNRRKRDGYKKAYDGVADVRFGGSVDGHNIQAITEETSNIKTRSENRFRASERGRRLWMDSQHLGVEKQEIENRHMRRPEGHALTARTGYAQIDKQRVENEFNDSGLGHQVRYVRESVDIDKITVDSRFGASSLGHQIDQARREAERVKQTVDGGHDQAWHFRNLTDTGSQEREMRLRVAQDTASRLKGTVDAVYTELKAGKPDLVDQDLADEAYAVAEATQLTANRNAQATGEVRQRINKALLKNGVEPVLDAAGNAVIDPATGKPAIAQRTIDGKPLQEYATGIGRRDTMLANAIAEDRSEWSKQSSAAGELIAHSKLASEDVQKLARGGAGTSVTVYDDDGNEFTFEADDEYVKEAAIIKQFKEGSYGQKMQILKETGEFVQDVDEHGNVFTRRGHNYAHRATVKNEAVGSGIAGLAPFINDVTYNEILKGNFNGDDSLNMHALRQIFEGRIKVDNLSGANNEALDILGNIGRLYKSSDPAEKAEFDNYKGMLFNLLGDTYGVGSQKYTDLVNGFDAQFDKNFGETLISFKQIMENSNLSRGTSVAASESIAHILDDNGIRYKRPGSAQANTRKP